LDWAELHTLIAQHFGVQMALSAHHDWVAIDGKVLRGTLASGDKQSVVFAVSHTSRTLLAHAPMQGSKASEIPVVRALLTHSQLEAHKVTLDAHHGNPQTTGTNSSSRWPVCHPSQREPTAFAHAMPARRGHSGTTGPP